MGLLSLTTLTLAVLGSAVAAPSRRQDAGLTYQEFSSSNGIVYRVAIPDVTAAPFDVAFQIVAPKSVGWAGIAWGGSMLNNPLTVAYPNGETVTASSRVAGGYQAPTPYAGAEYTVRPGTTVNTTHWVLDALCKGCSQWSGGSLDPTGDVVLAWAFAPNAVANPSSNTSNIAFHNQGKGASNLDLAAAKVKDFEAIVSGGAAGGAGDEAPASSSSAAAAAPTP